MGKRGPAPKPTKLRLLHGDQPKRIPKGEPVPAEAAVEPPPGLSAEAMEVWQRLAPDLIRKGVLTAWDTEAFGVFCRASVYARRAAGMVDASDVLLRGRNRGDQAVGVAVRNPALVVFRDMAELVLRSGSRYGLTPADRATLAAGETEPEAGADLLTGG